MNHGLTGAASKAASNRRYHAAQLAQGLCVSCPQPRAEGSKSYCARHLEKERERGRERRLKQGMKPHKRNGSEVVV